MNSSMEQQVADEESIQLLQLAEKVLNHPIKDGLIAYCPSMDLLAVVTTDEQAHIHRLNGQKVVSVPPRRGCSPVDLCWKPNGSLLAVAYSDNTLSLIAAQGGKIVHQTQCPVSPNTKITALGWGVSFTDVAGVQALLPSEQSHHTLTLDDVIHRGFIGEVNQPKIDLPSDLASLDVEGILPKLSVLPAGGKEAEVFTTRTSIDALFHSKDAKSSSADALLVGFDDGSAWLSVHDFFEIGRFDPRQIAMDRDLNIVKHAYHPCSSTHGLLLARAVRSQHELYFAPLDLKLIGEHGRQFSLVASKSTQLLNVLRYVKETQVQIYTEFTSSQTLPQRFLANVEEDLQEKEQTTFGVAAYHLVATGNCSPVVKEWLVDQLGDRGQKRWEKAAVSGYENTRKLIHENLLPALDRVTVLLARLKGLSLFQETANAFGLNVTELDHALDTLKCLHLLSHAALIISDAELGKSIAFCAWLKQEIDCQVTGHPPAHSDEPDKEPSFDYAEIFGYMEGPLQRSSLYDFFDLKHESDSRETAEMPSENDDMYDAYKTALQKVRNGLRLQKRLPGMAALIERVQKQCGNIFGNIADTQQKTVRFGDLVPVGECRLRSLDMRMVQPELDVPPVSYVALVAPDGTQAKVRRLKLAGRKKTSSISSSEEAVISAGPDGEIFDIKFIDDKMLCIGLKSGDKAQLLMLPYGEHDRKALTFVFAGDLAASDQILNLVDDHAQNTFRTHSFSNPVGASAVPVKIEVNGRKNRRALCVVMQDGAHYTTFDIDTFHNGSNVDDGVDSHGRVGDGDYVGEDIQMGH